MQVKKQQLKQDMEQWTDSKLGKEYVKDVYHHSAYLTYTQITSCDAELDEAQAGINTAERNISNLRYADHTILMAENDKELKSLLMKVKEESEKSWLKTQHSKNEDHGIWFHHFMANRWGNNGNSDRLYFWGAPKSLQVVTAAMKLKDACSLEEKL